MTARAQNPLACFLGAIGRARHFTHQAQHVPLEAEPLGAPTAEAEVLAHQVLLFVVQRTVKKGVEPFKTLFAVEHYRAPIRCVLPGSAPGKPRCPHGKA